VPGQQVGAAGAAGLGRRPASIMYLAFEPACGVVAVSAGDQDVGHLVQVLGAEPEGGQGGVPSRMPEVYQAPFGSPPGPRLRLVTTPVFDVARPRPAGRWSP